MQEIEINQGGASEEERAIFDKYCTGERRKKTKYCKEMAKKIRSSEKEELTHSSIALDGFLSTLGAHISSFFHHVVTPSSPLFPIFYAERVTFHFFHVVAHKNMVCFTFLILQIHNI